MELRGTKLGRNERCPCGSGKKFKRCHGDPVQKDLIAAAVSAADANLPRQLASEKQRAAQQGLGKPIISAEVAGHRLVAVGNKVHTTKGTRTFPDFLVPYVGTVLGAEWLTAELQKEEAEMYAVALWYRKDALHRRKHVVKPGEVFSAPEIGASRALLDLGYNLYLLEHNAELRSRLVARLRNRDQFLGAMSELRFAGMFTRAGFSIAFQNEDDSDTTHCEYDVTRTATGKRFSVEVKTRHWSSFPSEGPEGGRAVTKHVSRLLRDALGKQADHDRIVFIELAMPDTSTHDKEPWWMQAAVDGVNDAEEQLKRRGIIPPGAIVVITNHPHHLRLDATDSLTGFASHGIGPTEFRSGLHGTLHDAIQFRERHADFLALWKSIRQHRHIPMTFDGSNPHLAFGDHPPRLEISARYQIPGADGTPQIGILEDATVDPVRRNVCGVYRTADGQRVVCTTPMTEAEWRAYEEHPDTFFGVIKHQGSVKDPLELYDFFFGSYGGQSKERLLKLLAEFGSPDVEALAALSRDELAKIYCERLVNATMARSRS
jgi:hypothetical protein